MPASQPSAALGAADEKARARARVGLTIKNKYRLDALLGVGGMASVYAAMHRNGARKALKILHTEFARDASIRERFLREGYVANKVEHPGRVAIEDDDITEHDEPFLVMELLEGQTAQQLWKRMHRRIPPNEALWIASEVLDTLEAFHQQGIVHRDLKPANIFITREGVVKLLDFGVARMREAGGDRTRAGTALGTPSFMAPEQAMGLADGIDGRADIFSVGATLYALLSGQRLHQGRSDNEAFILAATTPAPSLARSAPELPIEVIALVDKALAWDQRSRFESAAAMREECLHVLELLGGPPPTARRAAEPPSRRSYTFDEVVPRRPQDERARRAEPAAEPLDPSRDAELVADPNDPSVQLLVDIFRRLERLLPALRHYGWNHPETDNKLRSTHQGIIEALRGSPSAVSWRLLPYAFAHRGQVIWEPSAPLDVIPYNLFAAGLRKIDILPGFGEDELRALCEVMMLDPAGDLAPEDDIAAALWEKRLSHVRYDVINVFAEGDAASREAFWAETDSVEEQARRTTEERANRAEAAAMAVETDQAALRAARQAAFALSLDPVAKRALGAQLMLSPERWSERFLDVIADAILNARRLRDLDLVLGPIDASVRDLLRQRRFDLVFSMFDAIAKAIEAAAPRAEAPAIKADLASGMFSPETLRLLVKEATRPAPTSGSGAIVDLDQITRDLSPIIAALGPSHFDVVFELFGLVASEGLRELFLGYFDRTMPGREMEIVDRLLSLDFETARPLLRLFSIARRPGALEALRRLSASENPMLRCEALALLGPTPDHLRDELAPFLDGPHPELRLAALRTLAHHQVKSAGPLLVRKVQDASFHQLGLDERREILSALYSLHPARAEAVLIEILEKRGLFSTGDAIEQTRLISVELLGEQARSSEAHEAVLREAKRRWGNSQALRDKCSRAAEMIAARLGKRTTESGEIT